MRAWSSPGPPYPFWRCSGGVERDRKVGRWQITTTVVGGSDYRRGGGGYQGGYGRGYGGRVHVAKRTTLPAGTRVRKATRMTLERGRVDVPNSDRVRWGWFPRFQSSLPHPQSSTQAMGKRLFARLREKTRATHAVKRALLLCWWWSLVVESRAEGACSVCAGSIGRVPLDKTIYPPMTPKLGAQAHRVHGCGAPPPETARRVESKPRHGRRAPETGEEVWSRGHYATGGWRRARPPADLGSLR